MTSVRILTTGGTIASRPDSRGGVRAAAGADELAAVATEWAPGVTVSADEIFRIGSYNMTDEAMLTVALRCREEAASDEIDGLVVTHGTDTLEETAYLVDLLYNGQKPVVFTGAQRNAAIADSDGPRNLGDSVRFAAEPAARGLGVVVCFAGRVDGARHATKIDTEALGAFASPGHGPVGAVTANAAAVFAPRVRPSNLAHLSGLSARVDLIRLYAGIDGTTLRAAQEAGAAGIVIEAFGIGNANHAVLEEVRRAVSEGVFVLVSSRCLQGFVSPVYGDAGGHDLLQAGAHFAGNLRGPKARILLACALSAASDDRSAVAGLLEPHLAI
jgi:L-asparaginase